MNRKYIFAAFAVAAAAVTLITAGCKSIEDEPAAAVNADVTMTSLTTMEKLTEALSETDTELAEYKDEINGTAESAVPNEPAVPAGGDTEPSETSADSEIEARNEAANPSVASVNELGNITALSEGSCTVKVTSAQNPEVFAEVEVTVTAGAQITYIDGILVVNKTYALPAGYNPGVNSEAQTAFDRMQSDAAAEDINIYISSGFRSYDYQAGLYQRYVDKDGKAEADRYSARAGHSEHQTGLAFDLNSIDDSFADTKEGKWVSRNCHRYGFIIRYPADKEDITGYKWEPWHIRYLGEETAQAVYDSGLCLEEYLGITSEYAD